MLFSICSMNLSTVRITGHQDIKMNVSGPFGSCLCTSALIPSRWWTRSRKPRRLTLPLSSESLWQSKSKCIQEWTKTQDHVMNSREQGRRRKRKRTAIDYIIYSSVHVRKKKQEDIYIEQGHLINHQGYLCNTLNSTMFVECDALIPLPTSPVVTKIWTISWTINKHLDYGKDVFNLFSIILTCI